MPEPNGWNEWSRHILEELKRLDKNITRLEGTANEINNRLIRLETEFKIKSGAVAGIVSLLVSAGIALIAAFVQKD